jgi:hypothetical protein
MRQKKYKKGVTGRPASNYSWKTSLPAYIENQVGKDYQNALVLLVIGKHRGKKATLKEVQDYLRNEFHIRLPQSTISGRMGDLRDTGKVVDYGETKMYKGRLRKLFEIKKKKKRIVKKKASKALKKKAMTIAKKSGYKPVKKLRKK